MLHRRARALLGPRTSKDSARPRPGPAPIPPRAAPKACFPAPRRGGAWSRVRVPGAGCARLLLRNCARLGVRHPHHRRPLVLPTACAPQVSETPALRTRPGKPPSQRAPPRLHGHGVRGGPQTQPLSPITSSGRPPGAYRLLPGPGRLPERAPLPRGPGRSERRRTRRLRNRRAGVGTSLA